MLFQFLLVIHVMAAMLWFGGTVSTPRRVRAALAGDLESGRAQLAGLAVEWRMMAVAALVVFMTGVSLVMVRGGFAGLPIRYHISLTLSLVWIVLGATAVRTMQTRVVEASQGDNPATTAAPALKRLAMLTGIQHSLFTVVTVLMLWRLG